MPLQKLKFLPGINKEITSLSGEGGWYDCDKVRFRFGYPEKIGGWIPLSQLNSFLGVGRTLINWVTLSNEDLLGIGTHLKYYIERGGVYNDITPLRGSATLASNAFTTTDESSLVEINDTAHGAITADFVTITTPTALLDGAITDSDTTITVDDTTNFTSTGAIWVEDELITYSGLTGTEFTGCTRGTGGTTASAHASGTTVYVSVGGISGQFLNGNFQITVVDADNFTIDVGVEATATETSGYAVVDYELSIGNEIFSLGTGWGAGPWGGDGTTGWGQAAATGVGVQLRLWNHANFGEWLIFGPRGSSLYIWKPDANPSTFNRGTPLTSEVGASNVPTIHNFLLVSDVSRFVICFGVNDYGESEIDPMLIRWSDQESVVNWTPSITNQASFQRLSKGSYIVAAKQTRQEILIWTDVALYAMQYLGPPFVWGINLVADNISISSPNSITITDDAVFWMGKGNFYVYNGRTDTLPCTVRKHVFDGMNHDQAYQVVSGSNQDFNEVWWFYCSINSTVVDRYVAFNTADNTWYPGVMSRSAWLDSPLRKSPMGVINGRVYFHEIGTDNGETNPPSAIECYIQSADIDLDDGDRFGFLWRVIPDISFNGSTVNRPTAFMSIKPRTNPGANYGLARGEDVDSLQDFSNARIYTVEQYTQYVYARARGRQLAFRVGSDSLGTQWQLGQPRLDLRSDGRRS